MTTEIDQKELDELREIIRASQLEEANKKLTTQLLVIESSRKKIKKINPKYCVEWSDLELEYKINRMIEFSNRYAEDYDLSEATVKKIRRMLAGAIKNETEELEVVYDSAKGQIISIPKLQYNHKDGYFLALYVNNDGDFIKHRTKISTTIQSDGKFSITTIANAVNTEESAVESVVKKEESVESVESVVKKEESLVKTKPETKITLSLSKKS